MFWTFLFLFLSAIISPQPVATPPVPTGDLVVTGKRINIQGPGTKPICRCVANQ
jgi:hypothetical protein